METASTGITTTRAHVSLLRVCVPFTEICCFQVTASTEAVSAYIALFSPSCPILPSFLIFRLPSSGLVETCVAIGVVIGPFLCQH